MKKRLTVFVNCSPLMKDGTWHLVDAPDSFHFTLPETRAAYDDADDVLAALMDKGAIHSYFIKRADDDAPTFDR